MQARTRKAPAGVHSSGHALPQTPLMTVEKYEAARAAWLAHGTRDAVCSAARIDKETASRLIDSGDPRLKLPSLRECARAAASDLTKKRSRLEAATVEAEATALARTLEARASAAEKARATTVKVLGDATRSREDEVRLVRANRSSALVLARVNADLLQVSVAVGASLLKERDTIAKLPAKDRLGILRTIAGIVQRTADASRVSVNMERLLMGEPTAILGHGTTGPSTGDMTPEEAEQWLTIANRAFKRKAARMAPPIEGTLADGGGGASSESDDDELYEDLEP